jgi:hypothetical protein
MQIKIKFDDIVHAFNSDDSYMISENEIIQIPDLTKEKVIEMKNKGFIPIPKRSSQFNQSLNEAFVYEIKDPKIAETFFEATYKNRPFGELIKKYELEEGWKNHIFKYSSNAIINWLNKNSINLPGQNLIPKIVLDEIESSKIPDEMSSYQPKQCYSCGNQMNFIVRYFKLNVPSLNILIENEVNLQLKEKGFEKFIFLGKNNKDLIAVTKCKCGSEEIDWDFC